MNGNYVSLPLAKKEYCLRHGLFEQQDIDLVSMRLVGRNDNNEYVFAVKAPLNGSLVDSLWGLERHNGRTVMGVREISFPHAEHLVNKAMVCHHFTQITGIVMRENDIGKVIMNDTTVDVFFHPDSMTFESYLTIKRI